MMIERVALSDGRESAVVDMGVDEECELRFTFSDRNKVYWAKIKANMGRQDVAEMLRKLAGEIG